MKMKPKNLKALDLDDIIKSSPAVEEADEMPSEPQKNPVDEFRKLLPELRKGVCKLNELMSTPYFPAEGNADLSKGQHSYLESAINKILTQRENEAKTERQNQGLMTHEECLDSIEKYLNDIDKKYKEIAICCLRMSETNKKKVAQPVAMAISRPILKNSGNFLSNLKSKGYWKGILCHIFGLLPLYYCRVLWQKHSGFICKIAVLVMFLTMVLSVSLTCILAHENSNLHSFKDKYNVMKTWCQNDSIISKRFNQVDYLYSDENNHQEEIKALLKIIRR